MYQIAQGSPEDLPAAATGVVACAWDLMADPLAVSGVWMRVLSWKPWWWWSAGTYLTELKVWQGAGALLEMNWYDPLIHQAELIGSFAMGPVILLGAVKLFRDYSRPQTLRSRPPRLRRAVRGKPVRSSRESLTPTRRRRIILL
jgi:hypothetical protein